MDVVTFLGPRIPLEVKKLFPLFQKLQQPTLLGILKIVVQYLKGKDFTEEEFTTISEQLKIDKPTLSIAFTGLFILLRGVLRSKIKVDALQKDLQELKIPDYIQQPIINLVKTRLESI
jgi:hypothetical protein